METMNRSDKFPGLNPVLLGIILLSLVVGAILYSHLPERVPIHWNVYGEIDGYGGRFTGAFGIPLLTLAAYVTMIVSPRIDPKRKNYEKFTGAYNAFIAAFVLFMLTLYGAILLVSFGYDLDIGMITPIGLGLLFIVMGNYLTRVRHNYFFGIKTPWTLASETVWRRTHRVGGILFVAAGLLTIASVVARPVPRFIITLSYILGASLVSVVYSYLVYRKLER
jgi:uncharacterized membrane protein